MLRSTFGDEKFFQLLKELAHTLAHKEIVTRDMQDVMEKVVGGNMDWFFDQWIRGVGTPQYAIFWKKRKNEEGKWIVEGSIKQRVVMGEDKTELKGVYYRGVAPLTFVDLNGRETKSAKPMLVQGAETPFKLIVVLLEKSNSYYLSQYGEPVQNEEDAEKKYIQVKADDVTRITSKLLADLPIRDITIADPPIEDVIERAFNE
jgi:aminopeptidase N